MVKRVQVAVGWMKLVQRITTTKLSVSETKFWVVKKRVYNFMF